MLINNYNTYICISTYFEVFTKYITSVKEKNNYGKEFYNVIFYEII